MMYYHTHGLQIVLAPRGSYPPLAKHAKRWAGECVTPDDVARTKPAISGTIDSKSDVCGPHDRASNRDTDWVAPLWDGLRDL